MTETRFYALPDGRRIAFRHLPGTGPTLVFLPGYMSDMEGGKATALDSWAEADGRAMLRFDYGGCGASPGEFEAQTLGDWRDDTVAMIDSVAEGRVVLVGSSMGGWIALLVARELARLGEENRLAGMVLIVAGVVVISIA